MPRRSLRDRDRIGHSGLGSRSGAISERSKLVDVRPVLPRLLRCRPLPLVDAELSLVLLQIDRAQDRSCSHWLTSDLAEGGIS
ncbi:Os02g0484250 [Oryza sativa Japonica Group]|uniref:Os02g0484250 protein n=1 Tax=Oryza sativa subsp. japonica TaxID=39947 RepID=A0A0N7KFA9_ORYSJ|nr:Os02g0484250 [Oryza sativa Japonica Group]